MVEIFLEAGKSGYDAVAEYSKDTGKSTELKPLFLLSVFPETGANTIFLPKLQTQYVTEKTLSFFTTGTKAKDL